MLIVVIDHQQHGMRCLLMYCLGSPRRTGFTSEHGSRTGETTGANDNEPAGPARESQARERQRARALRTRIRRVLLKVTGVSRITIAAQ